MRVLRILPGNRAGRSTLTEKLTVKWMRDTMRMIRGCRQYRLALEKGSNGEETFMYKAVEAYIDKLEAMREETFEQYPCVVEYCDMAGSVPVGIAERDRNRAVTLLERLFIQYSWSDEFVTAFGVYCNFYVLTGMHKCLKEEDSMEAEYGGFILFMYLLARGFPINRIAFLSAYITEEDSERTEKQQVLEFLEGQKYRKAETDEALKKRMEKVPSQKAEMLRILENPKYGTRDLKPYREIRKLLERDLDQIRIGNGQKEGMEEVESAKAFFSKIQNTGLIVENKIHKGNAGKLFNWLQEEEELEAYYTFRSAALNICDRLIGFYGGLDEKKNRIQDEIRRMEAGPAEAGQEDWMRKLVLNHSRQEELDKMKTMGIYHYVGRYLMSDFLERYPPQYFVDLLATIKNMLVLKVDSEEIKEISNHVVNTLVSYWEGVSVEKKYQSLSGKEMHRINEFSACVVLKLVRNWKMHNLIKNVDFSFMYFIFSLSVRLLGYGNEEWPSIIAELLAVKLPGTDQDMCSEISAKDLFVEMNRKMNKDREGKTFVQNIYKLYDEFGRDPLRSSIPIEDIYELFYLCLHFPYIEDEEVKFAGEDCTGRDELSKKLERMVHRNILQR